MLYLYEAIIGMLFGAVVYFFEFIVNIIRTKLDRSSKNLEYLLIPILVIFNVINNRLISQFHITKNALFMVVVILVIMGAFTYVLLNQFVKKLFVKDEKKNFDQSNKLETTRFSAKWILASVLIGGFLFLQLG